MTSFNALEISTERSYPTELYVLTLGSLSYFYTNAESLVRIDGEDYQPEAITRTRLEQGSDAANRTLTITVPAANEFARLFIGSPPGDQTSVSIFRLQPDELPGPVRLLQYKGTVNDVKFLNDGTSAEIVTRTIEALGNRSIPRYSFGGPCQHVLYGPGCLVDPALFQHVGTITAVASSVLTVSGAGAFLGNWFRGGFCRMVSGGDYRMITKHLGTSITLIQPFAYDVTGEEIQLFAGCDHNYDGDCRFKFNNQERFGGWPWVPSKNVFATGIR